jgi:GNAT superfamily N-acetyltransferase
MDAIRIRQAKPEDADAIAYVHRTSMREAMPFLPVLHTLEDDRRWVATVVLPNQAVWVAERDGQVVGVVALHDGWVEQLYILPGYQGMGIGSGLLATVKAASPEGLNLWAFQRNARARAFYERRGFVAVEFTDGTGNEEREPDVRYAWTPRR